MNTKTVRTMLLAIVILVAISLPAFSQTQFMSVDEVRQGMKGYGRTVFQGTAIEQFDVEVLGVLKNYAPKQDMILVRLAGGPLEHTGVIAGMSGSPVYIDGKLLGAVAFAFPFSKDPIAGVQPIAQMLNLLDVPAGPVEPLKAASGPLQAESPTAFVQGMLQKASQLGSFEQFWAPQALMPRGSLMPTGMPSLTRIQTPLTVSGATPAALQQFMPFFNALGFTPVQGGGGGSAPSGVIATNTKIEPGSSINVEMIRGDVNFSANGTVTHVDGNKIYAFGHPNMGSGTTDLPMSAGYVISLLPNIENSFKLAVPMNVVGAFHQDRSTGIAGNVGDKARMIPLELTLKSSLNTVNHYKFEMANDRFLTPLLTNFAIFNAITASERGIGEMTLAVSGKIHLKNYDAVNITNVFTGDANAPVMAAIATGAPIQYLMTTGYNGVDIEKIDLEIVSTERKTSAQLEGISVDKIDVRPGETITLTAYLRGTSGNAFVEKFPVEIPAGLPPGAVSLFVGDGNTVTTAELKQTPPGTSKDLTQIIKELNRLRKNDRLYIKILSDEPGAVIGGQELPSLPPSMVAVINSNRASSRSVSSMQSSTVREYELPQSKFVIQGQRSLNLRVMP
jgi:hypothetical protein